jgi:hypothetical protein
MGTATPTTPLFNGCKIFQGVKLITHLHLSLRLIIKVKVILEQATKAQSGRVEI